MIAEGEAWRLGLCWGGRGGVLGVGRRVRGLRGRFKHSVIGGRLGGVCVHGWIDGFWGSNLSWPWPGASVRIRRGPQVQSRWLGLSRF